jgi:DNA-binding IclR family transcriptional regulator
MEKPEQSESGADSPYIVPAVDRAMRLLALLSQTRREMSLAEITRELKLPHATAFRLAFTLERHGLIRRTPVGYEIGPRVLTLGFEYLASQDLVSVARPELSTLRDLTGVSANLGVLDGREVIYLCHVASRGALTSRVEVGSRLPAHAASIGRVLLSAMSDEALLALYAGVGLPPLPDTADTPEALVAQAAADRARGWVFKRGVFERDLTAIGAPVFNGASQMVAAINLSGPATAMGDDSERNEKIPQLLACARTLSKRLGFRA